MVADAHAPPNQVAPVDRDDVTVTRRPTLANGDGRAGADQVRAERRWATDGDRRSVGRLDVVPGQVGTRRATTMGRATLAPFFPERRAAAPEAERISVILDNWPVHVHPDVLVARAPHTTRWALSRPGNGPATPRGRAVRRAGDVRRPIQRMPLPTDASWRNPIEKLWRWMRQEVTRLHRWATDRDQVRSHLDAFFASFATGSPKLVPYVGLG